MSVIEAKARQTTAVEVVSEGSDTYVKAFRDGTLSTVGFVAALSAAGRVFIANSGTITTPLNWGTGDMNATEFDLHVAVPANVTIIPLGITLQWEAFGTIAIVEVAAAYGTGSVVGASGNTVTPLNANTQSSFASACTIKDANDTGGTGLTNPREFWRDGHQLAQTITTAQDAAMRTGAHMEWSWRTAGVLHLVGPSAQLAILSGSQGGAGFIILTFAETPSSWWA